MVDSTPLLTEPLCQLKVKLAEAQAVHERQEKALQADPEFGRLMDAARAASQTFEEAKKNLAAVEDKVTLMFLTSPLVVISWSGGKNKYGDTVRPEVIAAIKAHLPLAKLTTKNVESIVKVMMATEMARYPELQALRDKVDVAHSQVKAAETEYYKYSRAHDGHVDMYEEQREIKDIEAVLRDPEAAARAEDRERARVQIPEKIPAIYGTLIAELRSKGEVV